MNEKKPRKRRIRRPSRNAGNKPPIPNTDTPPIQEGSSKPVNAANPTSNPNRRRRNRYRPRKPAAAKIASNEKPNKPQPHSANPVAKNDANKSLKPAKSSNHRFFRRPRRNRVLPRETIVCAFCQKNIENPHFTFWDPLTGNKVHFDCVLDELKKKYPCKDNEKIYYLGSGNFGIVLESDRPSKFKMNVLQRFHHQEYTKKLDLDLSTNFSQIESAANHSVSH